MQGTKMMFSKFATSAPLILVFSTCALAAFPGGQNTYLPPNEGYNYPTPSKPFSPPAPPSRPTPPSRTPSFPAPPGRTPSYPAPPGRTPSYPAPPGRTPGYPSGPGPTPPAPYPPSGGQDHHDHHNHVPGMPFDFAYAVNDIDTANDYSHQAKSDGDVTRGEYRVQLPDGRTQIVRYTADWKTGYHAEVSYEGQARYPEGPSTQFGGGGQNQGYKY